jgi:hypothetical protein
MQGRVLAGDGANLQEPARARSRVRGRSGLASSTFVRNNVFWVNCFNGVGMADALP